MTTGFLPANGRFQRKGNANVKAKAEASSSATFFALTCLCPSSEILSPLIFFPSLMSLELELQEVHSIREKARARQTFQQGDNSKHMYGAERGVPLSRSPCGFCLSDPYAFASSLVGFLSDQLCCVNRESLLRSHRSSKRAWGWTPFLT
ncbi:hypothetical protein V6N11_020725 [Hibiscus sabdariffa]|uniref:Uncharacterized protein n=1 Tax=Hibiscus sabdariffa TaxID=183260 RepID=A0ABR2Q9A2_9ROSI